MDPNRVNLENHKPVYISLTVILLILSAVGIFLLYQIIVTKNNINSSSTPDQTIVNVEPTVIPTVTSVVIPTAIATSTAKITPTSKISPTTKPLASPSAKLTPTIVPKTTLVPSPTSAPINGLLDFSSSVDKFSVKYASSRKLYQDKETSGDRFTFSSSAGNFAVHVGFDDKWAWTNASRSFTNNFLVAGQPTFRYDISSQTIVDLQYDDKNYTIQCIHNGKATLKTECEEFLKSFQLL